LSFYLNRKENLNKNNRCGGFGTSGFSLFHNTIHLLKNSQLVLPQGAWVQVLLLMRALFRNGVV
jgi:hypothetical protein